MAASRALEDLVVESHKGPYRVRFKPGALESLEDTCPSSTFVVIDQRVADLYQDQLREVLARPSTLRIEATEVRKALESFPDYVDHLVAHRIRKGHVLTAVGGGILQDIVCFLAATLLRGLDWHFFPTTLLAQADSCIGSKSSINVRATKNVVGTFTPPRQVVVDVALLDTLSEAEIRSGVGEMLKVHAIAGPETFNEIAADYNRLLAERDVLEHYIVRSLELKRVLVENDEFDQGPRRIMNYGHSFGHAIESATGFAVPHGIAVTIGMDMANHVALALGRTSEETVARMKPVLVMNYAGFEGTPIPVDALLRAIAKDKKNTASALRLVLPDRAGRLSLVDQAADERFRRACEDYLEELAAA